MKRQAPSALTAADLDFKAAIEATYKPTISPTILTTQ
jgi:hypothetical protein